MSNIDWEKLQQLFHQAQRIPADEVDAFLDQACADQPKLKAEVLKLLNASHHDSADFTEQIAQTSQQIITQYHQGTRIGPYKIVKELGQGGMGSVYLAERADDQFDQQVAIKLISGSLKTDAIAERFIAERQILAGLKHPNIALLLDGGTAESGEPYFAMEYLQGENIIKYCDAQNLDIKQRIELFIEVCQAVSYAHGQLVLHRDIKPSNILISDTGQAKLLDFGIAKILKIDELNPQVTAREQMIMTPEYASPEQILGHGMSVASDVYQLGLVLYQLLTGQQAVQLKDASVAEVKSKVVDEQPLSPSQRMSQTGKKDTQSSKQIANNRSTQPASLMKKLKGDLDTIVLKCLNKEPAQRYHAVNELEADLSAYLEHRPIKARKLSLGYRLNRYLRRHWLVVSTSMLAVLALSGGLTFALFSLENTKQAELRANTEAQTAEQISKFLIEMITEADPRESGGEEITVKQVLSESEEKIDALNQQPQIQIRLLTLMSSAYLNLGELEKSDLLSQRAIKQAEQLKANEPALLIDALLERSVILYNLGNPKAALLMNEKAVKLAQKADLLHPSMLMELYSYLFADGQYEKANETANLALSIVDSLDAETAQLNKIDILQKLSANALQQSDYQQAENYLIQVMPLINEETPEFLNIKSIHRFYLGILYSDTGRYVEAEKNYLLSLDLTERIFGKKSHHLVKVLTSFSRLQRRMMKYDAAGNSLAKALEISAATTGKEHPDYIGILQQYSSLKYYQGDFTAAVSIMVDAIEIATQVLGKEHMTRNTAYTYILKPLNVLGRYKQSIAVAEEILFNLKAFFDEKHGFILFTKVHLATAKAAMGELNAASILAQNLIDSEQDRYVYSGLEIMFGITHIQGKSEQSERHLRKFDQKLNQLSTRNESGEEPVYLNMLARFQAAKGKNNEALSTQQESIKLLEADFQSHHPALQKHHMMEATILSQLNQSQKAVEIAQQSLNQWLKHMPPNEVASALLAIDFAEILIRSNQTNQAKQLLTDYIPFLEKAFPVNHHQILKAKCLLARTHLVDKPLKEGNEMLEKNRNQLIKLIGQNSPLLKSCQSTP